MAISGITSNTLPTDYSAILDEPRQLVSRAAAEIEEKIDELLAASGLLPGIAKAACASPVTDSYDGAVDRQAQDGAASSALGLPDVDGPTTSLGELTDKLSWFEGMSDGALMYHAFAEMARSSQRDMADANELRDAMQMQKMQAKYAQINATEKQIAGEREAATENLITSVVIGVVSAALSCAGAGLSSASSAASGVLSALGSLTSSLGNGVAQYCSKATENGGEYKADEAKLEGKRWEREEAICDDAIDGAKEAHESAKEQHKLALRILIEHQELQTQAIQKLTA